ncbi:hypothetical protein J8I26_04405 [Herbaspirillum sp. LeCh32-8]|nr:hypothetical protein [Herbaspirillum sp. LeCh32-8]
MTVNFTGGSTGPLGGADTPSQSQIDGFKQGLQGKSNEDLMKGLLDPNTAQWQKDAIMQELQNRADKAGGSQGAGSGGGEDDIQKLLKKLMDGTISDEELKKLAGLMGMKPEDLQAIKGAVQGQGVGEQDGDISGG